MLAAVDDKAQVMLPLVESWAAINSGSRNLPGLAAMADRLADAFAVLPGPASLVEADAVEAIDVDGRAVAVAHGRNLHLQVRPDAPLQLLLTGHMDTVFGPEHVFQQCRWIGPGRLNGPGVADMKGGLAVMLAALEAVERSTIAPTIGYEIVINSDEELSSPGSSGLIARAAAGKAAAFTYEPALAGGALAGARPGSGTFSIIITGRAAHAGRDPQNGRNAVLAAADMALRLAGEAGQELKVNPSRIDGGGPVNIVPDHAVLRVNLRPLTIEAERAALRMVDEIVSRVCAAHGVSAQVHGRFARPPKPFGAGAQRLTALVRQCGRDLDIPLDVMPSGGVCDGNNIAALGVPVIDTMGVRGGAIHSADEFLETGSLVERARLSALAIARLASGGAP